MRQHLELAVASRAATWPSGAFSSPSAASTWTSSPSTCTRRAPRRRRALARRRERREQGELRGADQDQPGRPADPHLPADPLDDALAAGPLDAIPSVLVSADDVSASHGGTVGELDEDAIFYMQSRGLDRPAAVRVIVEGFFEPLIARAARRAAGRARAAQDRAQAGGRARGHRGAMRASRLTASHRPPRGRSTCAPTSRSSRATFDGRPLVYLDSARDLAEAGGVIDALAEHLRSTTPTSTAASTRSRRRPTRPTRARAGGSRRSCGAEPRRRSSRRT